MQNTKTEYSSSERTPVVLPEMEQLLPPLSGEQFSALENDILENSCYAPIIVNEDMVVIDGHNRFRVCEKRGLPYRMLVFSFTDLLEAKQWALDTQKGRRNLDKWELGQIALKLKPEIKARARTNQGSRTDLSVNSPKSCSPTDTRKEMAQAVGIGEQAMGRIAQLTENAPQSLKDALENKELSINQGWRILKAVQQLPPEEREPIVAEMLSAVREIDQLDAEADRRHKIAGLFCKAYERVVLLTSTYQKSVGSRVYDRHPASLFAENEVNLSHPAGTVCRRRERSRVVSLLMRGRAPPAHSNHPTAWSEAPPLAGPRPSPPLAAMAQTCK